MAIRRNRKKVVLSLEDVEQEIEDLQQRLTEAQAARAYMVRQLGLDEGQDGESDEPTEAQAPQQGGWPAALVEFMAAHAGQRMRAGDITRGIQDQHPELEARDPHALVRATLNRLQDARGWLKEARGRETLWWAPDGSTDRHQSAMTRQFSNTIRDLGGEP